jgi:hypothetical protein
MDGNELQIYDIENEKLQYCIISSWGVFILDTERSL